MDKTSPLIAVVDDNEAVCKALSRLLRVAGLAVVTFSSGTTFLDSITTRRPDCVLLDLDMPEMDGFEVQARLAPSGIPVVILTGKDSKEKHTRAMASYPVAYLLKPVESETLLAVINLALKIAGHPGGESNQCPPTGPYHLMKAKWHPSAASKSIVPVSPWKPSENPRC